MKKLLFVFNPNAGKGRIKGYLLDILKTFNDGGCITTTYPTKARKDAYDYVLAHESEYDLIVCSGGDGTLNEVVALTTGWNLS